MKRKSGINETLSFPFLVMKIQWFKHNTLLSCRGNGKTIKIGLQQQPHQNEVA